MKSLIILVASIGFASSKSEPRLSIGKGLDPMSDEMIRQINSLGTTWKAGKNFEGLPSSYVKTLLGVREIEPSLTLPRVYQEVNEDLPATFDAREAWPNCTLIALIRDQGSCGSCWAVGSVIVMSDRICVASKGKIQVDLSIQDVLDCCKECQGGCGGGIPKTAWEYYAGSGIVSGGSYQGTGCLPYLFPPCQRVENPRPSCGHQCTSSCVPGYLRSYKDDKHFGQKPYSVSGTQQIMKEIMTNGPVTANYKVYADFSAYKSGVYQQVSEDFLSGHAVKVLGWGTENNVDYWLVANSWNTDWGDKGYFKIRRGTNECGIESNVIAGLPRI